MTDLDDYRAGRERIRKHARVHLALTDAASVAAALLLLALGLRILRATQDGAPLAQILATIVLTGVLGPGAAVAIRTIVVGKIRDQQRAMLSEWARRHPTQDRVMRDDNWCRHSQRQRDLGRELAAKQHLRRAALNRRLDLITGTTTKETP